jgi:hypothetical protein
MRPNPNPTLGSKFIMQGTEEYERGGHNMVVAAWDDEILEGRMKLELPFKRATNYQELYATVKYYLLLATEVRLFGFSHDFIPVNKTFVENLTNFCPNYPMAVSATDGSQVAYSNVNKSDVTSSDDFDLWRRPGYADRLGVAKALRDQDGGSEMSSSSSRDDSDVTRVSATAEVGEKGDSEERDGTTSTTTTGRV